MSKADKLPLETEPVARDNNTILALKPGDQTLSHLTQLIIVVPRFRTVAYGKHSLNYLGPVIWSKLDSSIRSSESLDILKSASDSVG